MHPQKDIFPYCNELQYLQSGATRTEIGFVALDIGFNAFKKGALEGFFGNGEI